MSAIMGYVTEVEQLDVEIKRLNAQLKQLRRQKAAAEQNIAQWFHANNLPGGRYRGKEIRVEAKPKRTRKKAKDKEADAIDVLKSHGVQDPRGLLEELQESQRGEEVENHKVRITRL